MCVSGGMDLGLSSAIFFSLIDGKTPLCVTYLKYLIAMRWQLFFFFFFICGVRVVLYWDARHHLGMDLYRQLFIFSYSFIFCTCFYVGYCAPNLRLKLALYLTNNYFTTHMLLCTFLNIDYYE